MYEKSILQHVRAEGYREGWAQASMLSHDDAFERGRLEADKYAPSRFRWFCAGIMVSTIIWWLL